MIRSEKLNQIKFVLGLYEPEYLPLDNISREEVLKDMNTINDRYCLKLNNEELDHLADYLYNKILWYIDEINK